MSIVRWKRKPIANEPHDIVRAVAVEAPKDVMVEVEVVAGFSLIFSTIFALSRPFHTLFFRHRERDRTRHNDGRSRHSQQPQMSCRVEIPRFCLRLLYYEHIAHSIIISDKKSDEVHNIVGVFVSYIVKSVITEAKSQGLQFRMNEFVNLFKFSYGVNTGFGKRHNFAAQI